MQGSDCQSLSEAGRQNAFFCLSSSPFMRGLFSIIVSWQTGFSISASERMEDARPRKYRKKIPIKLKHRVKNPFMRRHYQTLMGQDSNRLGIGCRGGVSHNQGSHARMPVEIRFLDLPGLRYRSSHPKDGQRSEVTLSIVVQETADDQGLPW